MSNRASRKGEHYKYKNDQEAEDAGRERRRKYMARVRKENPDKEKLYKKGQLAKKHLSAAGRDAYFIYAGGAGALPTDEDVAKLAEISIAGRAEGFAFWLHEKKDVTDWTDSDKKKDESRIQRLRKKARDTAQEKFGKDSVVLGLLKQKYQYESQFDNIGWEDQAAFVDFFASLESKQRDVFTFYQDLCAKYEELAGIKRGSATQPIDLTGGGGGGGGADEAGPSGDTKGKGKAAAAAPAAAEDRNFSLDFTELPAHRRGDDDEAVDVPSHSHHDPKGKGRATAADFSPLPPSHRIPDDDNAGNDGHHHHHHHHHHSQSKRKPSGSPEHDPRTAPAPAPTTAATTTAPAPASDPSSLVSLGFMLNSEGGPGEPFYLDQKGRYFYADPKRPGGKKPCNFAFSDDKMKHKAGYVPHPKNPGIMIPFYCRTSRGMAAFYTNRIESRDAQNRKVVDFEYIGMATMSPGW